MRAEAFVARALATWFGCGFWPWGPGTLGALAALLIGTSLEWRPVEFAAAGFAATLGGVWASAVEARNSGRKDPGHVVVDEVAGQWIAMAGAATVNWKSAAAGFVLFRLFDIWKPAPVRQLERLPGGVGIMADDVMAGVYAALLLHMAGLLHLY
jgi:phosphatidylglycerophosphatase A